MIKRIINKAFFLRIILPTLLVFSIFTTLIFAVIIPSIKSNMLDGKREMIKELTNSAWSVLDEFEKEVSDSILTLADAQKEAIKRIENLRYGDERKDYFWITDMHPNMIMHPYRKDLNNTNISDYKDPTGKKLFVEFVKAVELKGEDYVDYMWQWKDDSTKIVPKLSFVKGFKKWGWVIGTGIYIEDVNEEISALTNNLFYISLGILVLLGFILFYISEQSLLIESKRLDAVTEKKILEIENERKAKELDDARKLLLSMLPNDIPKHDDLEISVYLTTATEVGGDYYDFLQSEDGTLIVALGDATGHGTKAGLMVAIVKGLFKSLAEKNNTPVFFNKSTDIIKDMKLGKLFMSLLLLRIKDKKITASAAGMPPILVYRANEKVVESIPLKGMPVGAYADFPYGTNEFKVGTGDVVLILSDGLPELFNEEEEMYNYDRVNSKLSKLGELETKEIIIGFIDSINEWRQNRLPDDDITIMAIKFK